jgi:hypothetical protein
MPALVMLGRFADILQVALPALLYDNAEVGGDVVVISVYRNIGMRVFEILLQRVVVAVGILLEVYRAMLEHSEVASLDESLHEGVCAIAGDKVFALVARSRYALNVFVDIL